MYWFGIRHCEDCEVALWYAHRLSANYCGRKGDRFIIKYYDNSVIEHTLEEMTM